MKLHCLDVTLYPTNYELSYSVAATEGVLFPRLQYIGQMTKLVQMMMKEMMMKKCWEA